MYRFREWLHKKRIQFHLRAVEFSMRNASVDHLSEEQKKRRLEALYLLHEYTEAGQFPQNTQSLKIMPIFRDERGVLCAMGYLIHHTGYANLVNEIVETNNLVYLEDVDSGPVIDWLDRFGFSKLEGETVQPAYAPAPTASDFTTLIAFASIFFLLLVILFEYINYAVIRLVPFRKRKLKYAAHIYYFMSSAVVALLLTFVASLFLVENGIIDVR